MLGLKKLSHTFFTLRGLAYNHRYLPDRNSSSNSKFDTVIYNKRQNGSRTKRKYMVTAAAYTAYTSDFSPVRCEYLQLA